MERDKLAEETQELADKITDYLDILSRRERMVEVMLEELSAARASVGDERRTEISDQLGDQDDESLIQSEDMVVTVSHRGYIKRVPLSVYRAQRRGGKGRAGMKTRDEDFVTQLFVANTHTPILFFTSRGQVYQLKCYRLPEAAPQSLGKAMVNLLPIEPEETIQTIMPMPENEDEWASLNVMFATANGNIRRNMLSDFTNIKRNGKIAMKLDEGDQLIAVHPCEPEANVMMATKNGKAIRFKVSDVRVFSGRGSTGVRGIRLLDDDRVVSMAILDDPETQYVLAVTENGYGKRTKANDYRITGRGGQGVANIITSDRNGPVVASFLVTEDDQLMLATNGGTVIRIRVHGQEGDTIRTAGRNTQGVTLFSIGKDEKVVSVGLIQESDDDSDQESPETGQETETAADNAGDENTDDQQAEAQNPPDEEA